MFKNLTSRQKIMLVVLGIVVLACLILALYFALSKKSPPPKSTNTISFAKFSAKANPKANPPLLPWKIATYYKYSYMDGTVEGALSNIYPSVGDPLIKSDTETYPVLDFPVNDIKTDNYTIKVYRAVDDGSGNVPDPSKFTVLNPQPVIDYVNGNFTDTQNPYLGPPKPVKPSFKSFTQTPPVGGLTWKLATYYTYSYVDNSSPKSNVEGPQSEPTTVPPDQTIFSITQTDPEITLTPSSTFSIKIYRAVYDNPTNFVYLDAIIANQPTYVDTQNPYQKPKTPPNLRFRGWGDGNNYCPPTSTKCVRPCNVDEAKICLSPDAQWTCTNGGSKGNCTATSELQEADVKCISYCKHPN